VLKPFHQGLLTGSGKTLIDFTHKQETDAANYWRQKTPFDVMIDLRLPALDVIRIVLSFSTPYPCATLLFEDDILRVSHAEVIDYQSLDSNVSIENLEPGKILSASSQIICVKSGDFVMCLHFVNKIPDSLMNANYIHPPLKYSQAVKKLYSELGC
jgi:methionyl-tRNA formyltransferase